MCQGVAIAGLSRRKSGCKKQEQQPKASFHFGENLCLGNDCPEYCTRSSRTISLWCQRQSTWYKLTRLSLKKPMNAASDSQRWSRSIQSLAPADRVGQNAYVQACRLKRRRNLGYFRERSSTVKKF